jgi:hypothetical protein
MFTKLRPDTIQSDEGFSVEVLGRTGLIYTEGSRSLHISSEVLAGPHGLVIYRDSIKSWDSPHGMKTIDEATRDAIIENIRRAFRFDGFEIEVI